MHLYDLMIVFIVPEQAGDFEDNAVRSESEQVENPRRRTTYLPARLGLEVFNSNTGPSVWPTKNQRQDGDMGV